MGQFAVESFSLAACHTMVSLKHSIFVAEYGLDAHRCVCYSFAAALAGAMEYLRADAVMPVEGITAVEMECRSDGAASCRFEVTGPLRCP